MKQATIIPYQKENINNFQLQSPNQNEKSRVLPSWLKRPPSEHDLKNSMPSVQQKTDNEKDKVKKKPKLL